MAKQGYTSALVALGAAGGGLTFSLRTKDRSFTKRT